jgi:FkbM family methyltransferase
MISYASNREDVLLNRLFPADYKGFYVDVGACYPCLGSLTAHFYGRGWRGINIEPSESFGLFGEARRGDVNLQVALSNRAGSATFYEFPDAPGLSTFSRELAEVGAAKSGFPWAPRTVVVATLADVCRRHIRREIDFLSIDVEGHEREVLEGADWRQYRPRVVVIEATRPHTTETTHHQWEHLLLAADYLFACFDGLNRYYVRHEDRELISRLAVPVNYFDDFVTYSENCSLARAQALQLRLDTLEQMGPVTAAVAWRLNYLERRLPRLSKLLLKLRQKVGFRTDLWRGALRSVFAACLRRLSRKRVHHQFEILPDAEDRGHAHHRSATFALRRRNFPAIPMLAVRGSTSLMPSITFRGHPVSAKHPRREIESTPKSGSAIDPLRCANRVVLTEGPDPVYS